MQFKHYSNFSVIGSGNYVFRNYSTRQKIASRFAQWVDDSLTELIPDDFEYASTLEYGIICCVDSLERIEMSDNITRVTGTSILSTPNLKEVVFSKNIAYIEFYLFQDTIVLWRNKFNHDVVLDFSRAQQVPRLFSDNSSYPISDTSIPFSNPAITTIKVPSRLYNSWTTATYWKNIADKIIAV